MNNNHGNKTQSASFIDVCEALKRNIFRHLNVAELVKIEQIQNDKYKCSILTNPSQIVECICLQNLSLQTDDIALAIFTNSDFRTNLLKVKNKQKISKTNTQSDHSVNNGVLVGLVYRIETSEEQQ